MKNKKIITLLLSAVIMFSAYAQQSQHSDLTTKKTNAHGVNPNIERTRLVNEKIAANKANTTASAQSKPHTNTNAASHQPPMLDPKKMGRPAGSEKPTAPVVQSKKQTASVNATQKSANSQQEVAKPATQNGESLYQQRQEGRQQVQQQKLAAIQQHQATQHPGSTKIAAKGIQGTSAQQKAAPVVK